MKKSLIASLILAVLVIIYCSFADAIPPTPPQTSSSNATTIEGLEIENPEAADDGKYLSYDHGTTSWVLATPPGGGDMLASVWDGDSNGFIDLDAGGTNTTLADPGADRIMFWDDSGTVMNWLSLGTGLSITTTTMSLDGELVALAGLTSAANTIPYFTGSGTAGTITSSANMVSLLGSADYATARTNLGLAIGTNVQAYDAELASVAGLTFVDASLIQLTGTAASAVLTSGGNNYFLTSTSDNSALEFKTPANALTAIGAQTLDSDLTAIAGLTVTRGDIIIGSSVPGWTDLAIGAANTVLTTNGTDPAWSTVTSAMITNDTITTTDLAAALAFADGDYLDLSAIVHTANTAEGLVLPTWANVAVTSNVKDGTISYDAASTGIKLKTAAGWQSIGATAAPVDSQYLLLTNDPTLTGDRAFVAGTGLAGTDAGADGNYTLALDLTELTSGTTVSDGSGATFQLKFDVSTGTDPIITFGDNYSNFSTGALQVAGNAVYYASGTDVAVADGGTNKSSWTQYAIPYLSTTTVFSEIAIGTAGYTLNVNGTTNGYTWTAPLTIDTITDGSTYQKVSADDVNSSGHIDRLYDSDGSSYITITGLATTTRAMTVPDSAFAVAGININQNISGTWEVQDGVSINFGNDADWGISYDETTTDGLIFSTAAIGGTTTNPMFQIKVNSGGGTLTEDQRVFQITNNATSLLYLTEDGDLVITGGFYTTASIDPSVILNETTAGDTDYWFGINADQEGDNDDLFTIGTGTTAGTGGVFTVNPSGDVVASGTIKGDSLILEGGTYDTTIGPGTPTAAVSYTWPTAAPVASGYALVSTTGGTMSWAEITATAGGSATHVQYNSAGTLAGEAAFTYDATNNTLSVTQAASNPTLQVGDGTYSWGHTPQVGIEGSAEFDGVAYFDNTTEATGIAAAAVIVYGGLGVALDVWIGDDLVLDSDSTVLKFGADQDVTLTHVADTGLLLNTAMQLQFRDSAIYIASLDDGHLDLEADTSIDFNAPMVASENAATFTHSGTTSFTIASTSGTVVVESVVFTGSAVTEMTALTMGSATVDTGVFTMIKGAQTSDPQVTFTMSADGVGGFTIATANGSNGDITLTPSGGDTIITTDLTVSGGDIVLGTTSIFSGGDTASLNNIDAIDATTEATIEAAIDTLGDLAISDATPTLTLSDSDDAAGTGNIIFASANSRDITGTIQVDEGGTAVTYMTFDGVNDRVIVGQETPDDNNVSFAIQGDADSDAGGDTTEALTFTLTGNATPTSSTWAIADTQGAGISIVSNGTVTIESVVFTAGALSSVTSITDGTASWSSSSLSGFTNFSGSGYLALSADPPEAGTIRLPNAGSIVWEDGSEMSLTHVNDSGFEFSHNLSIKSGTTTYITLDATGQYIYVGENDTTFGKLVAYGSSADNGGQLYLNTPANYDDTIQYYIFNVYQDKLQLLAGDSGLLGYFELSDGMKLVFDEAAANPDDADVVISGADGVLTITTENGANNESLTIDFDATANTVTVNTTTDVATLSFSAINVVTTGTISGKIPVVVNSGTTEYAVTQAQIQAGTFFVTTVAGGTTYTLPGAEAGGWACFKMGQGNAQTLSIDTDGTDYIVMTTGARTSSAGDYYAATSSASNQICVVAFDETDWYATSTVGTWAEE